MSVVSGMNVVSPIGECTTDSSGPPVGVVRMDPDLSYSGVGELLQTYLNEGSNATWRLIKERIDYTFDSLDLALAPLERETGFGAEMKARVNEGQKLLFKPNLVNPMCIDPQNHGPAMGSTTCTEWPFIAALMRWFHDKLDIAYHQMSLGEAATCMTAAAHAYGHHRADKQPITTEAVIEGKVGDFYAGWGFYFVRRYLAECLPEGSGEDPMKGHEESIAGIYLPPGLAGDRLMVYDLNRIHDDLTKGREVPVADGVNYQSITLHKVVVGGDPEDAQDREAYPGCVLINVPKFKVHGIALLTNAIKNLGIGLYPMQWAKVGSHHWEYANPDHAVPGIKSRIPHAVWAPELDAITGFPKRDEEGNYIVKKTGGLPGTMVDIVKAVADQKIFMMHVVDGIEMINIDHQGVVVSDDLKVPDGVAFAGLDPVSVDLLCARYMFSNVGIAKAEEVGIEDGYGGHFPQEVPVPTVEGRNIVTNVGYDCPIARYDTFRYAEQRGLGTCGYHVVGGDVVGGAPLVSVRGHLGTLSDGKFTDLITETLFFDIYKLPWDLQLTCLSYMEAVDALYGTSVKQRFLDAFDENGDGTVTYEEFGRKGMWDHVLYMAGYHVSLIGTHEHGRLVGDFSVNTGLVKYGNPDWNTERHDLYEELGLGQECLLAMKLAELEEEMPDLFDPEMTIGQGKWPSYQTVAFGRVGLFIYGEEYPERAIFPGFYADVLYYADRTQNGGSYAGDVKGEPDPEGVSRYIADVLSGDTPPLDFVFYVPPGYGALASGEVPNVEETEDPKKLFTAAFRSGAEVWPGTTPL
jgi:hypothetical protein